MLKSGNKTRSWQFFNHVVQEASVPPCFASIFIGSQLTEGDVISSNLLDFFIFEH